MEYARAGGSVGKAFLLSIPAHLLMFSTFWFGAKAFAAGLNLLSIYCVMPIVAKNDKYIPRYWENARNTVPLYFVAGVLRPFQVSGQVEEVNDVTLLKIEQLQKTAVFQVQRHASCSC